MNSFGMMIGSAYAARSPKQLGKGLTMSQRIAVVTGAAGGTRLMKTHNCVPKRFITDTLQSYGAVKQ